jgi:hypothetical protein
MRRSVVLLPFVLVGLLAVPLTTAAADGPSAPLMQGGGGVGNGNVRYVMLPAHKMTILERVRTRGGQVLGWVYLPGSWGIPLVTNTETGGLAHDTRILVAGELGPVVCTQSRCPALRRTSRFAVFSTGMLRRRATISLAGDFTYDALSPDGRMLYLIQHVDAGNLTRYKVRAFDLSRMRLLPGAIADRSQRDWLMQGSPVARATSASGRFVYTLYQNPGGYPFVHALDTVRGVAHCVGLPWSGDQSAIATMALSLRDREHTLLAAVPWRGPARPATLPAFAIDTADYAVSVPSSPGPSRFPWWTLGFIALPFAGVAVIGLRRRRPRRAIFAGAR